MFRGYWAKSCCSQVWGFSLCYNRNLHISCALQKQRTLDQDSGVFLMGRGWKTRLKTSSVPVAGDHQEVRGRLGLPTVPKSAEFCRYRCQEISRWRYWEGFYRWAGNFYGALVCPCMEDGGRRHGSTCFRAGTEDSGSCYFDRQLETTSWEWSPLGQTL